MYIPVKLFRDLVRRKYGFDIYPMSFILGTQF